MKITASKHREMSKGGYRPTEPRGNGQWNGDSRTDVLRPSRHQLYSGGLEKKLQKFNFSGRKLETSGRI